MRYTFEVPDHYHAQFDSSCAAWTNNPEYNQICLNAQERYFNDLLRSRGWVMLNEVQHALGFPQTTAGCIVGWIFAPGTRFVAFNATPNLVEGIGVVHNLHFNVNGIIAHLIESF